MAYNPDKHGRAEYGRFMQIPESILSGMVEGIENGDLLSQRFAQFVYTVNPSPIQISGDVVVDAVGIDGSGTVKLSGDALKTFDQAVVDAIENLLILDNYSRVVQEVGTDVYVAHARPGSSVANAVWRIQKVDADGSKSWVDGASFSQCATGDFSLLSYSY